MELGWLLFVSPAGPLSAADLQPSSLRRENMQLIQGYSSACSSGCCPLTDLEEALFMPVT